MLTPKDIAYLPEWQQRIWSAFNVSPEGGVSDELLASQCEQIQLIQSSRNVSLSRFNVG